MLSIHAVEPSGGNIMPFMDHLYRYASFVKVK